MIIAISSSRLSLQILDSFLKTDAVFLIYYDNFGAIEFFKIPIYVSKGLCCLRIYFW